MVVLEKRLHILVIDDDPVFRNLLRHILNRKMIVYTAETPTSAFEVLNRESVDIIICDFKLPEMSGLQVMDRVKEEFDDIEFIMISAAGDMATVISALRKGATDFFTKPFTEADIWLAIERTRKYSRLHSDLNHITIKNKILKEKIEQNNVDELVGKSKSLDLIRIQIEQVAQSPDTSVLILGESGTGKELVARGIHRLSNRKDEVFGAVNMSAVPESLFESEFFGHKMGSFTGALADKPGWFEVTERGSLFLDEIGEMSMSLQVKLLRVLEDRKYNKLGSQKQQNFDIRIISATNMSLSDLSGGKKFRNDLFHRLGTFIINVPPLRERKNDIPELADYFLYRLAKKMGKNINGIDRDVFKIMKNYSFPGNIRELKNLIERAIIVCQGTALLPEHFGSLETESNIGSLQQGKSDIFDLGKIEKQTIISALKKANYNKTVAAKLLNIDWNALYRRIQKYQIIFPLDDTNQVFENED